MNKILAIAAAASIFALNTQAYAAEESKAKLLAEAKISEAQAKTIALAKVHNGVLKSMELEREQGRLVWSFDVVRPSASGVTEIQIDAMTGKITSTKHETPVAEANELKAEQQHKSTSR